MTVPTNAFATYAAIGVREDLEDVIYDISPAATPFMSNAPRGKATQRLHEWQTDTLASATVNAALEGDDASGTAATATKRFANYCMISSKVPVVTGTLESSDTAGRRSEMAYQVSKRLTELKRDIETAMLGCQGATAGAAGSARVAAGVGRWIFDEADTNPGNAIWTAVGFSTPGIASGAPDLPASSTSSVSAITEGRLKSAIALAWADGGDPTIIMCNAALKMTLSGFTGIATRYKDVNGNEPAAIIGAADVYVSDFGTHYIVANRFMPAGNVYVLDMDYWEIAYLRPVQQFDLAKTGDSESKQILAEYTLVARNPNASAKVCGMAAFTAHPT